MKDSRDELGVVLQTCRQLLQWRIRIQLQMEEDATSEIVTNRQTGLAASKYRRRIESPDQGRAARPGSYHNRQGSLGRVVGLGMPINRLG